ncbi:MAG: hypothetical protein VX874_07550 [Pseudomonadota bacterium]|nr:hypothetical protein [Pseudomonadota bacterium]
MPAKTPDPEACDTRCDPNVQDALENVRPARSQARATETAQVACDVADMPEELGNLLDKGIDEHLRSQTGGPRDLSKS